MQCVCVRECSHTSVHVCMCRPKMVISFLPGLLSALYTEAGSQSLLTQLVQPASLLHWGPFLPPTHQEPITPAQIYIGTGDPGPSARTAGILTTVPPPLLSPACAFTGLPSLGSYYYILIENLNRTSIDCVFVCVYVFM